MSSTNRCRLGRHVWKSQGRGDALTYVCARCGKKRDTLPRRRWGAADAPVRPAEVEAAAPDRRVP